MSFLLCTCLTFFLSHSMPLAHKFYAWEFLGTGSAGAIQRTFNFASSFTDGYAYPGSRSLAGMTSLVNNLYLFGGNIGGNYEGVLWIYNEQAEEWTWLDSIGDSVSQGAANLPGNVRHGTQYPGARCDHVMQAAPNNGVFYIFGGYGITANSTEGNLNDLWLFDASTNLWEHIDIMGLGPGSAEVKDVQIPASPIPYPSSRRGPGSWLVQRHHTLAPTSTHSLYIYGGWGCYSGGCQSSLAQAILGSYMWIYDSDTGEIRKEDIGGLKPGPRYSPTTWVGPKRRDTVGGEDALIDSHPTERMLYLFGGLAVQFLTVSTGDLWRYDTEEESWIEISGVQGQGNYHFDDETSSPGNRARSVATALEFDESGNSMLYAVLFGGRGLDNVTANQGQMMDLWIFASDECAVTPNGGCSITNPIVNTERPSMWEFIQFNEWMTKSSATPPARSSVYDPDQMMYPGQRHAHTATILRGPDANTASFGFYVFGGLDTDSRRKGDLWRILLHCGDGRVLSDDKQCGGVGQCERPSYGSSTLFPRTAECECEDPEMTYRLCVAPPDVTIPLTDDQILAASLSASLIGAASICVLLIVVCGLFLWSIGCRKDVIEGALDSSSDSIAEQITDLEISMPEDFDTPNEDINDNTQQQQQQRRKRLYGSGQSPPNAALPQQPRGRGEDRKGSSLALMEEEQVSMAHLNLNTSLYTIEYDELNILGRIGKGGSDSVVWKAKWGGTQFVAFKCFQIQDFLEEDKFSAFEREALVMGSVSHPNILRFFGACLINPRIGIVMEYCSNGDLAQFIERSRQNPDHAAIPAIRWLSEISDAMDYLHSREILHRDLKLQNVLLDDHNKTKLCDFGISKIVQDDANHNTRAVGTSYYMAPEITASSTYSTPVDVYSFSIMMFQLIEECVDPYENVNVSGSIEFHVARDPNFRPQFTKENHHPEWLCSLIQRAWDADPSVRPSFRELKGVLRNKLTTHEDEDEDDGGSSQSRTSFASRKQWD